MRIRQLRLKGFKRFDDLTIDLGTDPARVVALIGPNGCGKSSVFDAFEERLKDVKGAQATEPQWFYTKLAYHPDPSKQNAEYRKQDAIQLTLADGSQTITKKSFHIRSSYRFSPSLNVESLTAQPDIIEDTRRPHSSIAIDARLRENYERLVGLYYAAVDEGTQTGNEIKSRLLGRINGALENVLEVRISSLGNIQQRKGQLYFEKADAKDFPYQNLSSGEKEVVDLLIDLIVRNAEFNDTVYCIDEPELHLNTAIQRTLLVEIEKLIPPNCQLWIATHSVGFLRALQDELSGKCAILDFLEKNYFTGSQTMRPIRPTRAGWQRMFETAVDDLVGLIAPQRIVYCEGRPDPSANGSEQGLDATVYNEIFGSAQPTTLFISGGGTDVGKNSSLAIKVLSKAFKGVELLFLRDRDDRTDSERIAWLQEARHHRMLTRREIENYLFDFDALSAYSTQRGRPVSRGDYERIVSDIRKQDLKVGDIARRLKALCDERASLTVDEFERALAPFLQGTAILADLEKAIFSDPSAVAPVTTMGVGKASAPGGHHGL